MGAVAPTPILNRRQPSAGRIELDDDALAAMAAAYSKACNPIDDKRSLRVPNCCWRHGAPRGNHCISKSRRHGMSQAVLVSTKVNGDTVEFACPPNEVLLDSLRNRVEI